MYFYWAIIGPILPASAIVLSAVLIKEKKILRLILSSIICVFNIYISFNIINTFRRDYNGDLSIFPLLNYILYIIILNVVFILVSFLLLMKLSALEENRFIISVQSFFYKLKKNIFMLEKTTDKLLSIFLLFCLFYIVGFLNLFIHEFGHAMADVLVGTYYKEIRINLYLQGWASGYLLGSDKFLLLKANIISLGGLVAECLFASISLFIILRKKEKTGFAWLLSIVISMLFLNRVALYFTFPQFF
ncbi:MAG: M50 family metallopeptidase, partial [Promethearchaeota archaeon]